MTRKELFLKAELHGERTLTDAEVLEAITGIKNEKLTELIENVGLKYLGEYIDGFNASKAQKATLKLIYEATRRISQDIHKPYEISSSSKCLDYFKARLLSIEYERLEMAILNANKGLIKVITLVEGSLSEAPVYVRNVIKTAVLNNASGVIICHNHPSGSTIFSSADCEIKNRLKDAFSTVGISLIDFVIVTNHGGASMAEKGML